MPNRIVLFSLVLAVALIATGPLPARGEAAGDLNGEDARWAWKPVGRSAVPAVSDPAWASNPIDAFIFSKLRSAGLRPSAPADKRALIRRAYFDLVGIPPKPEAVEAFAADPSPEAFEKMVDGLLASPHFGERWARHWMDLVRYAEGHGHEFDFPIAYAWQYRDYLIRAFNADVPYDQFVREQIAGDLLESPRLNPSEGFNESIIGTGFWWFGEQIHSPVDVRQHQGDRIDNQIDVMAKTFLGLTVACARCHDHKFDPISQKDYTALFGIVESSRKQETYLDPHGKITAIAKSLESLRREGDRMLKASLPKPDAEWVDSVRQSLLATKATDSSKKSGKDGDPAQLSHWREALADESVKMTSHPLFGWANHPSDDAGFVAWQHAAASRIAADDKQSTESRRQSELLKSFADGGFGDWRTTGWAFGAGPARAGEWAGGKRGAELISTGSANSGLVANRLRGVLSSPSFILTKPQLLYHVAGQECKIRLIVDGYRMDQFSALLFAGALFDVKTGGKFVWHRQAQDVSRYVGHRAHIEIIDEGDGWIAVDEIRLADADAPLPEEAPSEIGRRILADPQVASMDSLAEAYAKWIGAAVERFAAGEADPQDARLVGWMIEHRLLAPDAGAAEKLYQLKKQMDALAARIPEPVRALATTDGNGIDEQVFVRGNHNTLGATAPRAFLTSIAGANQPSMGSGSGRLELANRMLDRSDPFVTRVMVNRVWHHLLGRGIVASVDNFGAMGERPSHPELLDYLANHFANDGWSVKRLIRQIVLSRTYQMSSRAGDAAAEQADPSNVLLHRANVRRLEAESIRDSILAASGRLDLTVFGPSVDVYLTPFMDGRGKPKSGPLDGDGRRSIYLAVRRNFLSPMMLAFDAPTPFNTVGRRSVSNVPAQALMLMNDPFVIQQARRWATRVLEEKDLTSRQRVTRMYQTAFSRPPSEREIERGLAFLESQAAERGLDPASADTRLELWADLAHALMNAKEFIFLN